MDKEELNIILLLYLVSNHVIPFHSLKFISIQNEGECNFKGGTETNKIEWEWTLPII